MMRQRMIRPIWSLATHKKSLRLFSSSSSEPFYGSPRPPTNPKQPKLPHQKLALAIHHATTAFSDPTRADAVAALGEITGQVSLERIHETMSNDETGRLILKDRPIVSKTTIPYEQLINDIPQDGQPITFGQAYGQFLKGHGFDPDGRDPIRYIDDDTLAFIMLRYRQCHDFWHALTGLPPTVLGELGLKYLELFQTGLPIAALSSTIGALRLEPKERDVLFHEYLPWALEISRTNNSSRGFLMNVYYEKEFDTPLETLRDRLNITPAPQIEI